MFLCCKFLCSQTNTCFVANLSGVSILPKALQLFLQLNTAWASSDVNKKEKLQNMMFPEGIIYELKKGVFRTEKVNEVFDCIAQLQSVIAENKTGQTDNEINLSSCVGSSGQISNKFIQDLFLIKGYLDFTKLLL